MDTLDINKLHNNMCIHALKNGQALSSYNRYVPLRLHPFASNLLELIVYNNSISNIKPSGMDLGLEIGKHHGWEGIAQ